MIAQLHLTNFKCFRRLDLPLAPLSLLAGLNGMGKSSVIQSLLLLRQSWRSGDLHSGRLALSGDLTDLGTGNDILFEEAEEDLIGIGLTLSDEQQEPRERTVKLIFAYNRESDHLEKFSDSSNSAHGHELPPELPPFGGHFHYVFAERHWFSWMGSGLDSHWNHEKLIPSKCSIKDSQGDGRHFFDGEMRSHEIMHNPINIQRSLKSFLIFCVGVGFPTES